MPLRETAIIVTLVNHPALAEEYFDAIESLDIAHPDLRRMHAVLIDTLAHIPASDRSPILQALQAAGLSDLWGRAVTLVRKANLWTALEDAALDDAREAFTQALHLHRSARNLHRELKAAEALLATDPTDENYRHMLEVQAQFTDAQATEALIEGFGIPSGRASR